MPPRRPSRFLHALALLFLLAGNFVAPAQAAVQALHAAAAREAATAIAGMPCDNMATDGMTSMPDLGPLPASDAGCDCCGPASCDLAMCLGIACLPDLARRVASIPVITLQPAMHATMPLSRLIETPLRPPIG